MIKTKDQLKDYVLLMLGAPVVAVNLNDDELNFCVDRPIEIITNAKLGGVINPKIINRLVQEGTSALGRYIVAKKKFKHLRPLMVTPFEDGFVEMIQANSDWTEFVQQVNSFARALRKPNDERDSDATSQDH